MSAYEWIEHPVGEFMYVRVEDGRTVSGESRHAGEVIARVTCNGTYRVATGINRAAQGEFASLHAAKRRVENLIHEWDTTVPYRD